MLGDCVTHSQLKGAPVVCGLLLRLRKLILRLRLERCARVQERLDHLHIPREYGNLQRRGRAQILRLERCARVQERLDHHHTPAVCMA